jgi:hypothetical protein
MELECPFLRSQDIATCPYSDPHEYNPRPILYQEYPS